jgi:hypothetical protein
VGEHDGTFYIVAELLQGDTLRERLKTGPSTARNCNGIWSADRARSGRSA